MTKEFRATFESGLKDHLKSTLGDFSCLKFKKNEISVSVGDASGALIFRYLSNANGYILSMYADVPELNQYIEHIQPPYQSNLFTAHSFSMTSSGEKNKNFSPDVGGAIKLPAANAVDSVFVWIETRLREVFLDRVFNILELRPGVIHDVLEYPEEYAYPFATIMYAISKNQLDLSGYRIQDFFGKKISKNNSFDRGLLDQYLASK